ncbi:ArsR family transcriptional regulator [Pyrobaculum ferrireducens]|nr:ArsR family transcriptional regulator [Pyrobaculum ferrireducens]
MQKLSSSVKLVLMYMTWRHLVDGSDFVTLKDMVEDLGMSESRLRVIISRLKDMGLLEIRPAPGARTVRYRLMLENLDIGLGRVPPGLYFIDLPIDAAVPGDLSLKALSVLRSARLLLYTQSHAGRKPLFRIVRCTCDVRPYTPAALEEARRLAADGHVAAVVYSSDRDPVETHGARPVSESRVKVYVYT